MIVRVTQSGAQLQHDVSIMIAGVLLPDVTQGLEMTPIDTSLKVSGSITSVTSSDVAFFVKFGKRVGSARIIITVSELQLTDTLWFTVKPGAPNHIRLKPADTAAVVGGTFTQDASIVDRSGNELAGRATFAATDAAITVSPTGSVRANTIGRTGISVTYAAPTGTLRDTAMVSVVPSGSIAQGIPAPGASVTSSIAIRRPDGSLIKGFSTPFSPFQTSWSPDGGRVYCVGASTDPTKPATYGLFALTVSDGSMRQIVPDSISALRGRLLDWPAPSRDDAWLYFSANELGVGPSVWRIHLDGTGAEQLVGPPPPNTGEGPRSPSPSPDGTRIAYVYANDVKILNLTTRSTTSIHGTGADEVRWAPSGERLATRGGAGLYVVNSDGSGMRQIMPSLSFERGLEWSPDGRWVVVKTGSVATIVDPDTGLLLPTPLNGAGMAWSN